MPVLGAEANRCFGPEREIGAAISSGKADESQCTNIKEADIQQAIDSHLHERNNDQRFLSTAVAISSTGALRTRAMASLVAFISPGSLGLPST